MISKLIELFNNLQFFKKTELPPETNITVTDQNGRITVEYPEGQKMEILWKDIEKISIHTNDLGPFESDVWWVLTGKDKRCGFPQGVRGENEMLSKFQKLEDFNNEQLIKAMQCTDNAEFVCWKTKNYI